MRFFGCLVKRKLILPGAQAGNEVEPPEISNQALDEAGDLPAAIEHDEEFMDDSEINIEPAYGQCRTASAANEMLAVVLHLIDRFENIVQRQVRAFFHEPGHQLGFP